MTAAQFVALLDKWGIKHEAIHSNWTTHNRNSKGNWGPVNGVMLHHTGSDDDGKGGRDVLWDGYGDLPGPLCHAGISKTGVVLLNGWGRVNHAGLGSSTILNHVINEDYKGNLSPGHADTDGNSHFYGFEIMYSGWHPMSEAQYKTAVRVSAAICTFHKWTDKSVIGHGEWQPGKWDPGYKHGKIMDMANSRNHIEQAIKEGPKPAPLYRNYTVVKNDTLYAIAGRLLKDGNRYKEIAKLNKLKDADVLTPGQKLKIPLK